MGTDLRIWIRIITGMALLSCNHLPVAAQDLPKTVSNIRAHHTTDTALISELIAKGKKYEQNTPDSAIVYYRNALQYSYSIKFHDGLTKSLYCLGSAEMNKGNYPASLNYFRQCFPYARTSKKQYYLVPGIYGSIGSIYCFQGDYKMAARYFDSSLTEAFNTKLKNDPSYLASIYNNLGAVYLRLNQQQLSIGYLKKSEAAYRKHKYYHALPNMLINKMDFYTGKNNFDSAVACFNEGMMLCKKYNLKEQEIALLSSMGELKLKQGLPEQALAYLGKIDYGNRNNSDYYFRVIPGYIAGKACFRLKRYKEAEYHLKNAIALSEQKNIIDNRMEAHKTLAGLYEITGRAAEALQQYKKFQAMNDTLLSRDRIRDINELEIRYRTLEKNKELAIKESNMLKVQVQSQRKSAAIWTVSLGVLLLVFIIIFLRYRQTATVKELLQRQQLDILHATIEGEETERLRLGQELHDGVSGLLSAIKMNLVALRVQRNDIAAEKNFITTMKLADETADELRKTAQNLVPAHLSNSGLGEAVKIFCERVSLAQHITIEIQQHGQSQRLVAPVELTIYRAVQELVHNIIKHAATDYALVSLSWQEHLLLITVEDHGMGIKDKYPRGMGLENIRKRVTALNGNIEISSQAGEGTSVYLEIPLNRSVTSK